MRDFPGHLCDEDDPHIRLWKFQGHVEMETLAAILADPARGFRDAHAAGCTASLFYDELHRLIWLAVAIRVHRRALAGDLRSDQSTIFHIVRHELVRRDEWDNDRFPERLADLAFSHFMYDRSFVLLPLSQLLDSSARIGELKRIYSRATALLNGEARP